MRFFTTLLLPLLAISAQAGVLTGKVSNEDGQAIAWVRREVRERTLFGHNGGDYGVSAEVWIDRAASVGIAIIMNGNMRSDNAFPAVVDLEIDLLDLVD